MSSSSFFFIFLEKKMTRASYKSGEHQDNAHEILKRVYKSLQDNAFTSLPNWVLLKLFN